MAMTKRTLRATTSQPPEISGDYGSDSMATTSSSDYDTDDDDTLSSVSSASKVLVQTRKRDYPNKPMSKKHPPKRGSHKKRKPTSELPSPAPDDTSGDDQDSTYTPPSNDRKPRKVTRRSRRGRKGTRKGTKAASEDHLTDDDGKGVRQKHQDSPELPPKKRSRKSKHLHPKSTYGTYIKRLFLKLNIMGADKHRLSLDHDALNIIDSFMVDVFQREAYVSTMSRYAGRKTLMVQDMVGATEILLQGCPTLLSHALKMGKTAIKKYQLNMKTKTRDPTIK